MPILLVDPQTANQASVINITTDERDERTYYVVPYVDGRPDTLIVCRNGLKLPNLARHIVDAATGTDSGYVGFTKKQFIGKNRPKITIYRTLNHMHYRALLQEELNRKEVVP